MAVGYIYQIKNILNNKVYIGSTNNYNKRIKEHYYELIKNKHFSKKLQRSWNKYGKKNFVFQLLEECDIAKFRNREQELLQELKPYFNNTFDVVAGTGYKLSKESADSIRKSVQDRWNNKTDEEKEIEKKRLLEIRKNYICTEEHKEKLRKNLNKTIHSEKALKNRFEVLKRVNYETKRKEVLQFTKDNILLKEFKSIREAGESLNLKPTQYGTITKVCKGKEGRTQAYGYIWKYKN